MWCSYSNVVIPKHATPCCYYKAVVPSCVSASFSLPRRRRQDQVGELGQTTLLANLESNSQTPISKAQQQGKQEGEQISGSDVLWALQRASAHKNMKKKNNKQEHGSRGSPSSSLVASRREDIAVDYSNVRPLCINDNWDPKLDELEKRLCQLSDTI